MNKAKEKAIETFNMNRIIKPDFTYSVFLRELENVIQEAKREERDDWVNNKCKNCELLKRRDEFKVLNPLKPTHEGK